jgi:fructose-1,6-bisphosphatase/inositol monophosphatase family enzyme
MAPTPDTSAPVPVPVPAALDPSVPDAELAAGLVRNAGTLALRMRERGLEGERKTSVSDVVTAADRAAEEYIVGQLRRCRPDDGVLGEEGASRAGTSGRCWVIDPVDGTYNFLSGSTYWCSALALKAGTAGRAGGPDPDVLLGAIYQPQEDKLWLGGPEHPATLNGRPLAPPSDLPVGQLSAGTYIHPSWLARPEAALAWRSAATRAATIRMMGSGSCDLARVAEGQLGCWFQHSCPEWDWLPGKAIVLAAGGAADVVEVNGLSWFLAGGPTAVRELGAALREGAC